MSSQKETLSPLARYSQSAFDAMETWETDDAPLKSTHDDVQAYSSSVESDKTLNDAHGTVFEFTRKRRASTSAFSCGALPTGPTSQILSKDKEEKEKRDWMHKMSTSSKDPTFLTSKSSTNTRGTTFATYAKGERQVFGWWA